MARETEFSLKEAEQENTKQHVYQSFGDPLTFIVMERRGLLVDRTKVLLLSTYIRFLRQYRQQFGILTLCLLPFKDICLLIKGFSCQILNISF